MGIIIQDYYSGKNAMCYGCGPLNPDGLHIQTSWDGREGVCRFQPATCHLAFPGIVYGGLIASLIDCHCIGTAVAAAYEAEQRLPGGEPEIMFVTANLNVRYIRPTPMAEVLILRARIKEQGPRKAIVSCSLYAQEEECAYGEVVAVRVDGKKA